MSIDFTIMYATHDAFRRDLYRLADAATAGRGDAPGVRAGWANFTRQLHVHHTVEDVALWPRVLDRLGDRPAGIELMSEMAAEHAALDPALHRVEEGLRSSAADIAERVSTLARVLTDHMAHEETAALPLIGEVLTLADWDAFRGAMARKQGPSGAAAYIPWVLDSTTHDQRTRFLAAMPGPVARINKLWWEGRYTRRRLWAY